MMRKQTPANDSSGENEDDEDDKEESWQIPLAVLRGMFEFTS
jgi:hypothetical protein